MSSAQKNGKIKNKGKKVVKKTTRVPTIAAGGEETANDNAHNIVTKKTVKKAVKKSPPLNNAAMDEINDAMLQANDKCRNLLQLDKMNAFRKWVVNHKKYQGTGNGDEPNAYYMDAIPKKAGNWTLFKGPATSGYILLLEYLEKKAFASENLLFMTRYRELSELKTKAEAAGTKEAIKVYIHRFTEIFEELISTETKAECSFINIAGGLRVTLEELYEKYRKADKPKRGPLREEQENKLMVQAAGEIAEAMEKVASHVKEMFLDSVCKDEIFQKWVVKNKKYKGKAKGLEDAKYYTDAVPAKKGDWSSFNGPKKESGYLLLMAYMEKKKCSEYLVFYTKYRELASIGKKAKKNVMFYPTYLKFFDKIFKEFIAKRAPTKLVLPKNELAELHKDHCKHAKPIENPHGW